MHQPVKLTLLGGFSLQVAGESVALPRHSRRVLAYLSVDKAGNHACERSTLSERLWPDVNENRSRGSLRTALWRIRRVSPHVLDVGADHVRLDTGLEIDVDRLCERATRIRAGSADELADSTHTMLGAAQLLPGWDETWLVLAREQLRQTRLHALEAGALRLRDLGRYPEAIELMLAVIAEEPLRESAHAALIEAHLSEGNLAEARRQFNAFAAMLWAELRLHPTPELFGRVGAVPPADVRRTAPVAAGRRA
jgi:DNA-binding SARP family transcriptional activator